MRKADLVKSRERSIKILDRIESELDATDLKSSVISKDNA